jgi:hypothetical protein
MRSRCKRRGQALVRLPELRVEQNFDVIRPRCILRTLIHSNLQIKQGRVQTGNQKEQPAVDLHLWYSTSCRLWCCTLLPCQLHIAVVHCSIYSNCAASSSHHIRKKHQTSLECLNQQHQAGCHQRPEHAQTLTCAWEDHLSCTRAALASRHKEDSDSAREGRAQI